MKKLLVPVDGSELSIKAAKQALVLAKSFGSKVTFLTAVEQRTFAGDFEAGSAASLNYYELMKKMSKTEMERATRLLASMVQTLDCEGIETEQRVLSGDPVSQIIETADAGEYDLIVMGHRGLNPIQRLFMGSVARRIIEDAPCSVFVVTK